MKLFRYLVALNKRLNECAANNKYKHQYKEYGSSTNPASGLPMCGGLDINGNSYDSSGSSHRLITYMNNDKRTFIGLLLILVIHVVLAFLIIGYGLAASSTVKSSFFYITGEGAGFPMFYYYIAFPVFLLLSIILFCIKRFMSYCKVVSCFPLLIWVSFYIVIEMTNPLLLVPPPSKEFYILSMLLFFIFFVINIVLASRSIKFSKFLYQI
jgi:hypothetical protein